MLKSPTRLDYMTDKVSFETYYRAVNATAGLKITNAPMLAKVRAALAEGDEHLNSISLDEWDCMALAMRTRLSAALKQHGDSFSLGGGVCCMKQAARDATRD